MRRILNKSRRACPDGFPPNPKARFARSHSRNMHSRNGSKTHANLQVTAISTGNRHPQCENIPQPMETGNALFSGKFGVGKIDCDLHPRSIENPHQTPTWSTLKCPLLMKTEFY